MMKVILRSDLAGLGKRGDIVDVADGYGRNYLLPRSLAFQATPGAVDQAARMRQSRDERDHSAREAARTIASTLVPKVIVIEAKSSQEGKIFGSVTTADIVEAVRGDGHRARAPSDRDRADQDARSAPGDRHVARRRVVPHHRRSHRCFTGRALARPARCNVL